MTTKNEHTGALQQTKPATDAFRDGWDRIFGTPRASKTYDEDMPLTQFGVVLEKYKS